MKFKTGFSGVHNRPGLRVLLFLQLAIFVDSQIQNLNSKTRCHVHAETLKTEPRNTKP